MDNAFKARWSSRKFFLCLGLTVLFTLLLVLDHISDEWVYAALMGWIWAWYIGGNLGEHWSKRR